LGTLPFPLAVVAPVKVYVVETLQLSVTDNGLVAEFDKLTLQPVVMFTEKGRGQLITGGVTSGVTWIGLLT